MTGSLWAGLRRHWVRWRNRRLASPAFQRWAAAFPLTRPFARRHTRQLFDLCAGFVYSQVLVACVQLGLFERLARAPMTAAQLAEELALPLASMRRLLEAGASLGLIDALSDDVFAPGPLGAATLGNPAVAAMVAHHAHLYADLADPVALLRQPVGSGALARYWAYAGSAHQRPLTGESVSAYTELMGASQQMIADQVLAACPLHATQHLLDIGGGNASFAVAAVRHAPALRATVFDLPAVTEIARARIQSLDLSARIDVHPGDFRRDALPRGADTISLIRIAHDHDDAVLRDLLQAIRAALPDSGRLLLAEPMAGTRGAEAVGAAYFGFYLLAMGQGRARTPAELTNFLRAAGFARVEQRATQTPLLARVLVAYCNA